MEDFNIDFSAIDRLQMKKSNILLDEIRSVFANLNSEYDFSNPDFDYIIGFSNRRKFIHMAYFVSKNINFEIELLQIDLPYEKDIQKFWCSQKKDRLF